MVNNELLERMKEWKTENLPSLVRRDIRVSIGEDILAIVGPRRAGKTYFLYQLLKEIGEKELYVDFEDIVYRNYNPKEIIDAYMEIFGRATVSVFR